MNKKITSFGLVALAGLSLCAGVALSNGGVSNIRADEVNTWKHFAAVMPTDTTKGIREYWTNCISETRLSAPEGVSAEEATLNAEQIETILADADDTRIIPTLSEISASVAKGYDGSSAYQGSDVECAYAYTYLDETTKAKISGADEAKIVAAYNAYSKYYSVLVDVDGMDNYANTVTSVASDGTYCNVLKVNSSNDLAGENWTFGPDRKAELTASGISAIRFAIYSPQAMDVGFVNGDCNKWYNASTGEFTEAKSTTTMAKDSWKEFTIPVSAINQMDSFFIGIYLSPSPYIGYGCPTASDSAEKGSAYISEIIGVKNAYYDETYVPLFEEAVSKISSTASPTRADAYYIYKAGQYLSHMSEDAKKASEKLEDYNAAKGNCAYTVGGLIDASTFAYTAGGAMESALPGFVIDSEAYDTVSFYVKSDWDTRFDLSKSNWWTSAYDFSAGSWVATGMDTTFRTGADTWALCTMSVADFNLCKYYSFLNNGAVGQNFYISPIYLSNSGSN